MSYDDYDWDTATREALAFVRLLVKLGYSYDAINKDWLPAKVAEFNQKLKQDHGRLARP